MSGLQAWNTSATIISTNPQVSDHPGVDSSASATKQNIESSKHPSSEPYCKPPSLMIPKMNPSNQHQFLLPPFGGYYSTLNYYFLRQRNGMKGREIAFGNALRIE